MSIIHRVKRLNLPPDQYVVYGSGPIEAMLGKEVREARDVDIVAAPGLFDRMADRPDWGLRITDCGNRALDYRRDTIEAFDIWDCDGYRQAAEYLLKQAVMIDGVPFAPLTEVIAWKGASERPKDRADAELIEAYMQNTVPALG